MWTNLSHILHSKMVTTIKSVFINIITSLNQFVPTYVRKELVIYQNSYYTRILEQKH